MSRYVHVEINRWQLTSEEAHHVYARWFVSLTPQALIAHLQEKTQSCHARGHGKIHWDGYERKRVNGKLSAEYIGKGSCVNCSYAIQRPLRPEEQEALHGMTKHFVPWHDVHQSKHGMKREKPTLDRVVVNSAV